MKLKYPTYVKVKLIALGLFVIAFLGFAIPASGITFGSEVTSASTQYPSVVSIWYAESSADEPKFFCTGTLIDKRIVLTAAHCIYSNGLLYVKYGADELSEDLKLHSVSAVWKNPRYSASQSVNDVGLLLLEKQIPGAVVFPLTSSSKIVSFQKSKAVKYRIIGWGIDQNEELPTYLRTSVVTDQSGILRKSLKWWRDDVWFAVGKYIKSEGVYSGICSGDSGGPLLASLNAQTIIVGVASFTFAEECEVRMPSVFSRLSYYISDINKGISQLSLNEIKQNRALPSFITKPKVTGEAKVGSVLTCDTGSASSNTADMAFKWTTSGAMPVVNGKNLIVPANPSTTTFREFTCIVAISNSNGSVVETTSIKQSPSPTNSTYPSFAFPTSASNTTSTATCAAAKFANANSIQNEWWIGSSSNFALASRISSGNTITLDTNFYVNNGGKYLFCVSRASGDGGTSDSISSSVLIPSFEKPVVKTYPKITGITAGVPVSIGSVATCSDWSWQNKIDSEEIAWYGNSTSDLVPATKIGTGKTLVLSQALIEKYGNAYIMCLVTGKNSGGYLGIYTPVLLTPPNSLSKIPLPSYAYVSIEGFGISSTVPVGITATCKLSLTPKDFDVTYTWGISTYAYPAAINTVIATGQTLVISDVVFSQLGNNSLACQATMSNAGGSRSVVTGVKIYKPLPSNSNATVKPNPVQDFTGNIGEKGTTLSWSPPKSNGAIVTSYVVERTDSYEPGVNGESVWRVVGTTSGTTLFVAELNPCHSSNYRMRAFTGTQYSDYSPTLGANNARRCDTVLGLVSIGSPVSVPKGFTLQINNFDNTNFEWKVLLPVSPQGRYAQVSSTGLISDSEMTPGVSARLYIFKISRSTGEYVGVTTVTVVAGR